MRFLLADDTEVRDLAHRTFWTAVEVLLGFFTVELFIDLDVATWKLAFASAAAAAFTVVKEFARRQLGKRTSGPAITTPDA